MAHISPYTTGITSSNYKKYNDLPDPSSPSTKPLSDSYEAGNGLNQDQLNLLPTWQELEQSIDWQLYHKKLDFTFNTKDLLGANKLTRLMREHKVYHQPYDICPLRRKKSRESYSKSCEPRATVHEASQTDFDLASYGYIKPLAQDRSSHVRRSSSLSNKSPYSNLQNELYGVDSSRINYSIRNSYISPGRKDNYTGDDLHNLTIPSEKNTPDSFYRDIGVISRIEQSNLSTRDSVGLPHVPSKFAKERYGVDQIQNFKNVNGSFETNNENFSSNRNVNPKILIIDSGINDHDSGRHANIKNDISNQRDIAHLNLDYIAKSGGSCKREIVENNKDNEEEYSYRYKSSDEKSSGDEQKGGILKKKNTTKVEKKQNDSDRIRGLNNAKFKFIGDSEANKDKAHDISRLLNDDSSENKTYSNRNIIDIHNLLKPQLIQTILEYPDLVILQGELMKYKPGVHFSYVKRWVEITSTELRYYKNRIRANTLETTPILIIPIQDIKAVYRVNIKLPKKIKQEGSSKGVQKLEPVLYHFEVFTNNHPLPSPNELDVTVHTDISAIHDKSMLFSPEYGFNANNKSRINESKNSILPSSGYRESSHLMPPPPLKKRNEPSQISSIPENCDYEENNLLSGSLLNQRSGYSIKGPSSSLFKNQREQNSAASAYRQGMIRKNTNQVSQISEEKDKSGISTKKDPNATYHYVKTIEDFASWTGRHKEWYDSEKRLLFCSVSKKEREIWLSVINWLIKASNR